MHYSMGRSADLPKFYIFGGHSKIIFLLKAMFAQVEKKNFLVDCVFTYSSLPILNRMGGYQLIVFPKKSYSKSHD